LTGMLITLKHLLQQFDAGLFDLIKAYTNDLNTHIMVVLSFFASHTFLLPANIILAVYFLFIKKDKWSGIRVIVISATSYLVMSSLKLYFHRARPMHPVHNAASGFSFPSGHSMSAMTFYGLLIYLVARKVKSTTAKWLLSILFGLLIILIGFSRVYLRVHFGSDVLAGFTFGFIWLMISLWVLGKIEDRETKPTTTK
jgi:membrane-associated phospholipid phosphatase